MQEDATVVLCWEFYNLVVFFLNVYCSTKLMSQWLNAGLLLLISETTELVFRSTKATLKSYHLATLTTKPPRSENKHNIWLKLWLKVVIKVKLIDSENRIYWIISAFFLKKIIINLSSFLYITISENFI